MLTVAVDDGIRLHYREAGSGPALLFHPGFSSTLDMWNWLVRELAPTYRCITFDPRGHGASDKPDSEYTLDELAWPHQAVDRGQYPPWHELPTAARLSRRKISC